MSSVFMAQVVKPMSLLHDRGWEPTLLVFAPIGEIIRPALLTRWRERRARISSAHGLHTIRLPSPPSRFRNLWSEMPLLRHWLQLKLGEHSNAIVHCRGPSATILALGARAHLPGLRVIFDCRGMNGAECAYVSGYARIDDAPEPIAGEARMIETSERMAALDANRVICVSEVMKQYICNQWGVAEDKVSVVPCCTDTEAAARATDHREVIRHRLGLNDRLVVAYNGSLERWQLPETCLDWFKRIASMRPDAHLLAITTHPDRMNKIADAAGIPESQRTVFSTPQQEVAKYLAVADCGLLVRGSSLVNRVASPVKFAEYLAVGVPVLISDEVGDYSDVVREQGIGVVLPEGSSEEVIARVLSGFFARLESEGSAELTRQCQAYAASHLSWARAGNEIESVYRSLCTTRSPQSVTTG